MTAGVRNYVVHGAGAIGGVIAARLADAGCDVRLVARGEHLAAIQRDGLTMSGLTEGRYELPAADDALGFALDDQSVVILAMKTQDTFDAVLANVDAYRGLPLFCFQNGVTNEEWLTEEGLAAYGVMVRIGARIAEPGHVQHTGARHALIGRWPVGTDDVCDDVIDDLVAGDIKAKASHDICSTKWGKLVINLANAYLALVDRSVAHSYSDVPTRRFLADVEAEALAVTQAAGVTVAFESGETQQERIDKLRAEPSAERFGDLPATPTYPSTHQDLVAGRTTVEVEHFNGRIVRLGREVGVPTPLNEVLWRLCDEAAAAQLGVGTQTEQSIRQAATTLAP